MIEDSINIEDFKKIKHPYPDRSELILFFRKIKNSEKELKEFIKLWYTEGVPYIMKDIPFLYEKIRSLISDYLKISFKDIFMIGSGKIGFSLSRDRFLKDFSYKNPISDLDFTIVNNNLFNRFEEEFYFWEKMVEDGKYEVKTSNEIYNLENLPKNLKKGFIDFYKLPHTIKELKTRQIFILLVPKLKNLINDFSENIFSQLKISFRVYKDWESFLNQNIVNIEYVLNEEIKL